MARKKQVVRHCLSSKQEKRLKSRGLNPTDAVHIAKLYACTMEELLRMYKCRKSMIQNPVAKANLWLRKNRPGREPEDEPKDGRKDEPRYEPKALVYYDISTHLETWVPYAGCVEGDVVLVMDKQERTYRILAERCHKIERLHANGFKYPETKVNGMVLTSSTALQHGDHVITKGSRVSVLQSNVCAVERE